MCEKNVYKKENVSDVYNDNFFVDFSSKKYKISLNFSRIPDSCSVKNIKEILHKEEIEIYETFKFKRRSNSFLFGRYSAKQAAIALNGSKDTFDNILIKNGVLNQPVVIWQKNTNTQVSITHCDGLAASIAFSNELLLGIDIEKKQLCRDSLGLELTIKERNLSYKVAQEYDMFLLMVWTAKESLSKVLKTGLTVPISIFEIKNIELYDDYFISGFTNFLQYYAISFFVEDYICSITYPRNSEISINVKNIKSNLYKILCGKK